MMNFKNEKKYFYNSLSIIDNDANVIHKYYKKQTSSFWRILTIRKYSIKNWL